MTRPICFSLFVVSTACASSVAQPQSTKAAPRAPRSLAAVPSPVAKPVRAAVPLEPTGAAPQVVPRLDPPSPIVEARLTREFKELVPLFLLPENEANCDTQLREIAFNLARLGRLRNADEVIAQMHRPNNLEADKRVEMVRLVFRRHAALNDSKSALETIPLIANTATRLDANIVLARIYLQRGEQRNAHRILEKVEPLLVERFRAGLYVAYLAELNGDHKIAQRLFDRRKTLVDEMAKDSKSSRDKENAEYHRYDLGRALLKAGLADDFEQLKVPFPLGIHGHILRRLVEMGRADVAIRMTRAEWPMWKIQNMAQLATLFAAKPETLPRAKILVNEAYSYYRRLVVVAPEVMLKEYGNPKIDRTWWIGAGIRDDLAYLLVDAKSLVGDEAGAGQLFREANAGKTDKQMGRVWISRALNSFVPEGANQKKSSPAELARIHKQLMPWVHHIYLDGNNIRSLNEVVKAEIDAKQLPAARELLTAVEKLALALLAQADRTSDMQPVLEVAHLWRKLGDEAHTQALIETFYTAPTAPTALNITSLERASTLAGSGFREEAHTRAPNLLTFQPASAELSRTIRDAKENPNVFPEWIARIPDPARRLQVLTLFTKTLTAPLLENNNDEDSALRE